MRTETMLAVRQLLAATTDLRLYARHQRGCLERMGLGNPCDCGFAGVSLRLEAEADTLRGVLDRESAGVPTP